MNNERKKRLKTSLAPGDQIQWYVIKDILGLGGFGITYLAHDLNLDHAVAIKEYMPAGIAVRNEDGSLSPANPEADKKYNSCLQRFVDEARTLGRFRHPNIVRVRNVFELNNTAYMVMDYELGETLQEKLNYRKTLNFDELNAIIPPMVDGLSAVHETGFIHRDIKPANIFIRIDGEPVLLDFGSARKAYREEDNSMTGFFSQGYAPIEQYHQAENNHQGPWTDIYALAATLYRAIAGVAPMDAMDRMMSITRSNNDPYVSMIELASHTFPERLLKAIDHGLRFHQEDRPQSIETWNILPADEQEIAMTPPEGLALDLDSSAEKREAFESVQAEITKGDINALSNLGFMYAKGIGVEKDETLALQWYRKAAERGHRTAQFNLGVMYSKGRGTEQDFAESLRWYKLAAEQGDTTAESILGMLYARGIGIQKNYIEAVKWYQRAALKGHTNSQYNLANLYLRGRAVNKNETEAFKLYKVAANNGHVNSQLMLAYLYGKGIGIQRDDNQAYLWYLRAAEEGNANAQYNLGVILSKGRGTKKDLTKAMQWYRLAAEQGDQNAIVALQRIR